MTLEVVETSCADASRQLRVAALRELYTEHVLPDSMLSLFNNGVDKMSHVVNFGQDTLTERPRLVGHFTQFFITHLARDDSCPTPSWFCYIPKE